MDCLPRRESVPLDKHVDMPRIRVLSSEALGYRQRVPYYCLWGFFNHLFHIEMVKGKKRAKDLGKMEFESLGKTVGILLRIWNTGRVVILDSGFCVLPGIVELAKRGLHGGALIKKRRYWPKWILGEEIKAHFAEKEVGSVDCWNGNLNDQAVKVFCFKEPDYVMSIMSAYGIVNEEGVVKNGFSRTPTERSVKFARFATQRSSTTTTNIGMWLTTTTTTTSCNRFP
jgi:hypothetical protein